jgi:hypothetical protein
LILPIKSGGLGIPDYMKNQQCAYSASIYECSQTISKYFPNFLDMVDSNKTSIYFYNAISNISLLRNNNANSLPPISLNDISNIYLEGGKSLQSKLCQLYAENTYDIIKRKKTDANDLAFFIGSVFIVFRF